MLCPLAFQAGALQPGNFSLLRRRQARRGDKRTPCCYSGAMSCNEDRIARAFCQLQMLHKRSTQAIARDFGLTVQQMTLLWHVAPETSLSMGQVAEKMDCDLASITGLVDKLEASRLLQRIRSQDRRVKQLQLTDEGASVREAVVERLYQPPSWVSSLSLEEQEQLATLLGKCLSGVETLV